MPYKKLNSTQQVKEDKPKQPTQPQQEVSLNDKRENNRQDFMIQTNLKREEYKTSDKLQKLSVNLTYRG